MGSRAWKMYAAEHRRNPGPKPCPYCKEIMRAPIKGTKWERNVDPNNHPRVATIDHILPRCWEAKLRRKVRGRGIELQFHGITRTKLVCRGCNEARATNQFGHCAAAMMITRSIEVPNNYEHDFVNFSDPLNRAVFSRAVEKGVAKFIWWMWGKTAVSSFRKAKRFIINTLLPVVRVAMA